MTIDPGFVGREAALTEGGTRASSAQGWLERWCRVSLTWSPHRHGTSGVRDDAGGEPRRRLRPLWCPWFHRGGSSNWAWATRAGRTARFEGKGESALVIDPVGDRDSESDGPWHLEEKGARLWSAVWHDK